MVINVARAVMPRKKRRLRPRRARVSALPSAQHVSYLRRIPACVSPWKREFLHKRAYPWLAEVTAAVLSLTAEKEGKLTLPYSSSPEFNDDRFEAHLEPNSNFDQALLTWAAPDAWADGEFVDLRAEGGFLVSATRRDEKTTAVTVKSARGGVLTLKNPFAQQRFRASLDYQQEGEWLTFSLAENGVLELAPE